MSIKARPLLLTLALGAGILLALVIALPYIVSLDSVRARILGAAEASLHRGVEAGPIRLEIFSGLGAGIEKFTVKNGPGWETPALASIDRLSIKLAFWPLLSGRVEVRRVVLDGATMTIERDPSGKLNVSDLIAPAPGGGEQAAPPAAAAVLVSRLEFSRCRFLFVDRKVSPEQTVTVSLDDLMGEISDVGPTTAAHFELEARLLADAGRNLSLEGTFGPPVSGKSLGEAPLAAKFAARGLVLARLKPYLGASGVDPGILSLDSGIDGVMLGTLRIAGGFSYVPPQSGSRIPPIDGKLAMSLDWPGGSLLIEKSAVTVAKLPLTAEGRIEGLHEAPRLDLRVATQGDAPLDAVTGLAGTLPAGVKLSGRVRLNASVEGRVSELSAHASADAAPFTVSRAGESLFFASSLRATLASAGKGPMNGRITAPSGKLQSLPFEDLAADWTWDKGALTLSPALRSFGGTIRARVEADLSHPKSESRASLDVQGVQAKPLAEAFTSMRNVVSGTLALKASLASRGLTRDDVAKTGRGEGRLSITDAELKSLELLPKVTGALSAVGRIAGFQTPASLESTRFSKLETGLRLSDGRVATPGLTLSGRGIIATADGSIGLDRTLSYRGRVLLGPEIMKSFGNAGRYLADAQGNLAVPFRATGPVSAPKVTIDESLAVDLGRRVLARQARDQIKGGAGAIVGDALEGSGDGKAADPLDLLQQFLQKPGPTPTPH